MGSKHKLYRELLNREEERRKAELERHEMKEDVYKAMFILLVLVGGPAIYFNQEEILTYFKSLLGKRDGGGDVSKEAPPKDIVTTGALDENDVLADIQNLLHDDIIYYTTAGLALVIILITIAIIIEYVKKLFTKSSEAAVGMVEHIAELSKYIISLIPIFVLTGFAALATALKMGPLATLLMTAAVFGIWYYTSSRVDEKGIVYAFIKTTVPAMMSILVGRVASYYKEDDLAGLMYMFAFLWIFIVIMKNRFHTKINKIPAEAKKAVKDMANYGREHVLDPYVPYWLNSNEDRKMRKIVDKDLLKNIEYAGRKDVGYTYDVVGTSG